MKSVINLIKTPQGYSILQGDVQINKAQHKNYKEKSYTQPKKFAQQNFTIYPYIPNKEYDNHKYILIPAKSQWFNLNSVHQIQKKGLPQWFKIKKGIFASMNTIKFQKHEQLYKKYRNYIIQLGKYQYVSPSRARKGLAGDVCAIIRIHKFLQKWGIINYVHKKPKIKTQASKELQLPEQKVSANKRKDCFEKDKGIINRTYNKDDLQLLKKITKRYRSVCHFCQGITGIVWYEYIQTLYLKKIQPVQNQKYNNVKSQSQTFNYTLTLCASCFHQGNIPVVLNISDFKKICIVDKIQSQNNNESQKKRNNEQNKIADAIEKYKFNIVKTAQNLKMTTQRVFTILMTMPIQKLQKISRIQPETEDERDQQDQQNKKIYEPLNVDNKSEIGQSALSLEEKIRQQVNHLQSQQRQIYQKFLQSWLLKINTKISQLSNWQQSIESKFGSTNMLQRHFLAEKIRNLSKSL